ncbi:MAG: hypothetical protein ACTSUE_21575 [Promethearchaeota archaeon]
MNWEIHDKTGMKHVRQFASSCGLASTVMALRPWRDGTIRAKLNLLQKHANERFKNLQYALSRRGTNSQFVMALVILEANADEAFKKFLVSADNETFEFTSIFINNLLQTRVFKKSPRAHENAVDEYMNNGAISSKLLHEYAGKVKTDVELKLLFAAFGFRFIPWPGTVDGTGALQHLLRIKGKRKKDAAGIPPKNVEFQDAHGFFIKNFDRNAVILNRGFHWVAVKKIVHDGREISAIFYLDPAALFGREIGLQLGRNNGRFYFFAPDEKFLTASKKFFATHFGSREPARDSDEAPRQPPSADESAREKKNEMIK